MKKINTQIPQPKTLYEALRISGGADVYDAECDMGVYMECEPYWEKCDDSYDRFMLLLAINIECDWFREEHGEIIAKISEFMWDYKEVFEKFMNENNREGYRPCDYEEIDPDVDSGFYETYMMTFESLIVGYYSEEQYESLCNELMSDTDED